MSFRKFRAQLATILLLAASGSLFSAERPNILWITSEDNSIAWVGCYGGTNAKTPNIDKLATEGFRYKHCFDNAAVCAPTRSTWITGLYAISMGTQPMRSRYAIPHDLIPYYPDQLRKAGYHVSNGGKTDYNIGSRDDKETWQGSRNGDWSQRKEGQPFFTIVNIGDSHESNAFPKKGRLGPVDPAKMTLHPYHPDLPEMRDTYARYADGVERMDKQVGATLAKLEADGLAEDTIVVYCSDHGGGLPRGKRFLYSSGTHCPLIVRIPEKWKKWWPAEKPGDTVDRIVAFVDMPKTWVSLAGGEIPETYQGTVFLGDDIEAAPKYNLSFRERADECADFVRSMRDERYLYIRNYMPWFPNGQRLSYMWTMTGTPAWEKHYQEGKCDEVTGRFFEERPEAELYDTVEDYHNIDNLIDAPAHAEKIAELKKAMRAKQLELFDSGLIPEAMRVRRAAENKVTIYEMVRDPKLYPLERYLDAADLALAGDKKNLEALKKMLADEDPCLRYWAACGLFQLGKEVDPDLLRSAFTDEADEVRMMAAWALRRQGEVEEADAVFAEMNQGRKPHDGNLFQTIRKVIGDPLPSKKSGNQASRKNLPGPLLKNWELLGPFPGDKSITGDKIFAKLDLKGEWKPITKGIGDDRIDLDHTLGRATDNAGAFVRTTLVAKEAGEATLSARVDDHYIAQLNGKIVKNGKLSLKKGENSLILKVIDDALGWRFEARVHDGKGEPIEGLQLGGE